MTTETIDVNNARVDMESYVDSWLAHMGEIRNLCFDVESMKAAKVIESITLQMAQAHFEHVRKAQERAA